MDKDLAEFSIKHIQDLGASYAEARLDSSAGNSCLIKNSIPQISSFEHVTGLGVRFIVNNTLGFMSTNTLDKENIKTLLKKSFNVTQHASRLSENTTFAEEQAHQHTYAVPQKIPYENVGYDEKVGLLLDADKHMRDNNVKIVGSFLSLSDNVIREYFVNTEGSKIDTTVPKASFYYVLTVQEGDKSAQRYWQYGGSGGYEIVKQWNIPELLAHEITSTHENLQKGVRPPTGKLDVVVAPQVVAIMAHESVGHPYEADRILGREAAQAGESFLSKDMQGHQIGSEHVTVIDDPTIEGGFGFYLYDNEGVKSRKRVLINNGKVEEFLHNRATASELGTTSNAAARAIGYDREPIIRMANTVLEPGDFSEEELIEGVKHGVFMKNFMEWNIDDKRLNQKYVGAESYLIKNGKLAEPLAQPTIEINTPDLWKAVDGVAKNTEYHSGTCGKGEPCQAAPVWFGGPSIRLRNIILSGH